ncbi:MAG: type II toxin-antitoxin system PemK/MazF family toxin [Solirubrobacterales bacterium]|nr:type II toxin-antitoxin system PemK/MazF family toxin [Solirubrobacterales bacterium]MCB8915771.1 type II toxin-antitoxin system PemK/MazF family toxin [Thermoleophilales bacterium]
MYEIDFPHAGPHPGVVVTREEAIPVLGSVTIALVTSNRRDHPAEVSLDDDGLDLRAGSVINCDDLATLPKSMVGKSRGYLSPGKLRELNGALAIALGLD